MLSNVAPKFTHDMVTKYLEGEQAEALKMQLQAIPLVDALFCEVNPIPVKAAMDLMGWDVGPLRAPLSRMEPQNGESNEGIWNQSEIRRLTLGRQMDRVDFCSAAFHLPL